MNWTEYFQSSIVKNVTYWIEFVGNAQQQKRLDQIKSENQNILVAIQYGIVYDKSREAGVTLLLSLSSTIQILGNWMEWQQLVDQAISLISGNHPETADLQNLSADLLFLMKKFPSAQKQYLQAFHKAKTSAAKVNAKYGLARTTWAMGKYDKAFEIAQGTLEEMDNEGKNATVRANIFSLLGMICYSKKDYRPAIEFFRHAIRLYEAQDGTSYQKSLAHHNLALVLSEELEFRKAIYHYHQAKKLTRDLPFIPYKINLEITRGIIHFQAGEFTIAQRILEILFMKESVLLSLDQEATIHYYLGYVHLASGNEENGKDHLRKAMLLWQQTGSTRIVVEIEKKLDMLQNTFSAID